MISCTSEVMTPRVNSQPRSPHFSQVVPTERVPNDHSKLWYLLPLLTELHESLFPRGSTEELCHPLQQAAVIVTHVGFAVCRDEVRVHRVRVVVVRVGIVCSNALKVVLLGVRGGNSCSLCLGVLVLHVVMALLLVWLLLLLLMMLSLLLLLGLLLLLLDPRGLMLELMLVRENMRLRGQHLVRVVSRRGQRQGKW